VRAVGRLGGWTIALVALLTAQPLNRLTAQTDSPLQTIDTIIIENHNIFDRDSDDAAPNWVARLANRLHQRTRQWVVRRRLLLERGDSFDLARMEESERALRSLGVFRSVRVDTVRAGGKLALRAVTADGWSTQPQMSFSSVGGDKTWSAGLVERNVLGTGTEFALLYGHNPDRNRLDFEFINPQIFGRRTLILTRYSNLSDGRRGQWQFGVPFTETVARNSIETYGEAADERLLQFKSDTLFRTQQHRLLRLGLTGGIALHATTHAYARLWGGWEWRREDYADSGVAVWPYSVFTAVRAGFEVGSVRFRILEHFNSYARREDVDLSPMLHVGAVVQSGLGYEVSGQTSVVWPRGFAVVRLNANGLDSTRTHGELTVVSQNIPRHTVIVHAEAGFVTHARLGHEFDLWNDPRGPSGPRLFGVHDFTGTRMTWFVLEDRILVVDDILGLMALGLAPFLDYGGAWYGDQTPQQGGDAGISIRFGPTRAVSGEAAEVAVGYRFGVVRGGPWAITIRKGFSF
jgi:hypothetical protein